jgi:diaminopimelate decarboxylase
MSTALAAALENFTIRNGELTIGGKPVSEIARAHGTPLYIYSTELLRRRFQLLRDSLPVGLLIYYAVKANPKIELIRLLGGMYDGLDLASKGEMIKALEAGISADKMSMTGPGKSVDELEYAIARDIGAISVESDKELEYIAAICDRLQKSVPLVLRVNPPFELAKSKMKMGGGPKQFGVDSADVPGLLEKISANKRLRYLGLHIFAGSQNLSADAILESFEKVLEYAVQVQDSTRTGIRMLNLGGGFGIPYFPKDQPLDNVRVGLGLKELLSKYQPRLEGTRFKIELGRYIVGECGLYVSEVLYKKKSYGQTFLITNGGMHHYLAASGNLGQSLVHRPFPATVLNRLNQPMEPVNIVGPLCTPLDTLGHQLLVPRAEIGDLVGVMNAGAYGYSASPLGFLSHQPPGEVIV